MSRLYTCLTTEPERWRILGAIVPFTGEFARWLRIGRSRLSIAFRAVDLTCRARANNDSAFGMLAFERLLEVHWRWHGVSSQKFCPSLPSTASNWPDAVRRMLLSLTHTDSCETLYMAMCGLRFFGDVFTEQIPTVCREGLVDKDASDAILSLAQLWATRHPNVVVKALPDFVACEANGALEDRLDAWAIAASNAQSANSYRFRRATQEGVSQRLPFQGMPTLSQWMSK